jgi:uncharacterized MAPEG superfamily protein
MPEFVVPYYPTVAACVVLGILVLVQIVVLDVAGIRAGHVPGMPVTGGHESFHFRATRAHANTNENLALLVLLVVAAVLIGAAPTWTNRLVGTFVASRAVHMLAYYGDVRLLRSAAFAVGLICLVALAVCAAAALG